METDNLFFDINSAYNQKEKSLVLHIVSRIEGSELIENKNIKEIIEDIRANAHFFCHRLDEVFLDEGIKIPDDIKKTIGSIRKRLHDFLDFRKLLRRFDLFKIYENIKKIPNLNQKIEELEFLLEAINQDNPLDRNKFFLAEIARTYMELGNDEKALEFFLEIIKKDPQDPYVLSNIGNIYKKQKKNEIALEYFQLILEQKPLDLQSLSNIGFIYLKIKNYIEANNYFEKVLIIDPNQPKIQDAWKEVQTKIKPESVSLEAEKQKEFNSNVLTHREKIDKFLENGEKTKAIFYLLEIKNSLDPKEWEKIFNIIFNEEKAIFYPSIENYQKFLQKLKLQQNPDIPFKLGFFLIMSTINQYKVKRRTKPYSLEYTYNRDRQLFYANYNLCPDHYSKKDILTEYELTKENASRILHNLKIFTVKTLLSQYPEFFYKNTELEEKTETETPEKLKEQKTAEVKLIETDKPDSEKEVFELTGTVTPPTEDETKEDETLLKLENQMNVLIQEIEPLNDNQIESLVYQSLELSEKAITKLMERIEFYKQEAENARKAMLYAEDERSQAKQMLFSEREKNRELQTKIKKLEKNLDDLTREQLTSPPFQLIQLMSDSERITRLLNLEKKLREKEKK